MNISRKELFGYGMLILAGGLLYLAFDGWKQGLALFIAGVLIDIGIDHIMLKWEKARGEVD